ncbi:hypothetical protein EPUL_005085 [Erysiphe pulchra]|uniref:Uncharacterized protein n=1 Tax=Erysiphe pulchra TaxID=225359 RepID=A0A2S4PT28_9PEZI|nr:hypothetical protein EPUL_005085 [Erysiphe pulchra]
MAMFIGLISGLPNMNRLDVRSDSISQLNRRLPSTRPNMTPLSHHRKRALFGGEKKLRPGVKCDSTFYKQSRVEAIANKACTDAYILSGNIAPKNKMSYYFKKPLPEFPAPYLFPQETGNKLTMIRITRGFFSWQRLRAFLRFGKMDYIVFGNACRTVGIVRKVSKTEFVLCTAVNGGAHQYNAPQPQIT